MFFATRPAHRCQSHRRATICGPGETELGYYPLALAEARRIRNYLQFPDEAASILDPCAEPERRSAPE
jgi:hypothetical protein